MTRKNKTASEKKILKKSRIFFFTIFALTAYGAYSLVSPYIGSIAVAFLFSIFIYPLFKRLQDRFGLSDNKSLLITILVAIILIITPLVGSTVLLVSEANRFSQSINFDVLQDNMNIEYVVDRTNDIASKIPFLDYQVTEEQIITSTESVVKPVSAFFVNAIIRVGGSSASIATNIIVFILLIATLIPSIPKLKSTLSSLSPMDDEIDQTYITRVITLVNDMIRGTFLIAIVQGGAAGVILWIMGVDYVLTLTVIMIIASAVPVIGTSLVTLPVGLYLILSGNLIGGVILILLQIIVIANIDNYMRPKLVSDKDALHPLLLLLGVFGGMSIFGLLGFIYGPVVMILFVTSLEVYKKYYR